MNLDIETGTLLVSTILPILVGIVTKKVTHSGIKATLLALLSAATGAINSAVNNDGILSKETLFAAFIAWVIAVATYYGFLVPTGVSPTVNEKTRNIGV
jgi:hypothetical protein